MYCLSGYRTSVLPQPPPTHLETRARYLYSQAPVFKLTNDLILVKCVTLNSERAIFGGDTDAWSLAFLFSPLMREGLGLITKWFVGQLHQIHGSHSAIVLNTVV